MAKRAVFGYMAIMILGVEHAQVSIPVGSEAIAKEFYCSFLELIEVEKPENLRARGGFWLQVGDLQVHFDTEDGIDRTKSKAHVAYRVSDLEEMKSKLRSRKVEILDGLPIPGAARFEFRDPFGNRVELIQRLTS